jgi:hypothetical protein
MIDKADLLSTALENWIINFYYENQVWIFIVMFASVSMGACLVLAKPPKT